MARDLDGEHRDYEQRNWDRLFEANKHMSTLCAAALAIVFGAERLGTGGFPTVSAATMVFALALLFALIGLFFGAATKRSQEIAMASARGFFTTSVGLFYVGVLFLLWR